MIIKLHNNCIELPQEIIRQASLKEGDCLDCVYHNNTIYLIPILPLPETLAPAIVENISPLYISTYQNFIVFTIAALYQWKSLRHWQ